MFHFSNSIFQFKSLLSNSFTYFLAYTIKWVKNTITMRFRRKVSLITDKYGEMRFTFCCDVPENWNVEKSNKSIAFVKSLFARNHNLNTKPTTRKLPSNGKRWSWGSSGDNICYFLTLSATFILLFLPQKLVLSLTTRFSIARNFLPTTLAAINNTPNPSSQMFNF